MSELTQFIQDLRSRGVQLSVEASKLKVKVITQDNEQKDAGTKLLAVLSKEEMERLKAEKEKIIRYLTQPFLEEVPAPVTKPHRASDESKDSITQSLSYSQQSLWTLSKYMPNNTAFNMLFACNLPSDINVRALQAACKLLVDRHPQLRSSFVEGHDGAVQKIHNNIRLPWKKYSLDLDGAQVSEEELADAVESLFKTIADTPFDFEKGAIKFIWVEVAGRPERQFFGTLVHHLVADFFSYQIILAEISALYNAVLNRRDIQLPSGGHDYAQWIKEEESYFVSNAYQSDLEYWRGKLQAPLPVLSLRADRPRPKVFSFNGGFVQFDLNSSLATGIKEFAKSIGVTPSNLLLSIYGMFLADEAKQSEVLIGTPTGGRLEQGYEWVIGDFSNTIVLRLQLSAATSILSLIYSLKQQLLEAMNHQKLPFSHLVEKLQPVRSTQHAPIFQAMFLWHQPNERLLESLLGEQQSVLSDVMSLSGPRGVSYDLMLSVVDAKEGMHCNWGYSADLFDEESVANFHDKFVQLIEAVISKQYSFCGEITSLSPNLISNSAEDDNARDLRFELRAISGISDVHVMRDNLDRWLVAVLLERDEFYSQVTRNIQDLINARDESLHCISSIAQLPLDWSRDRWLGWFDLQPKITPDWLEQSALNLSSQYKALQLKDAEATFNVVPYVQWPKANKVHLNVDLGLPWNFSASDRDMSNGLIGNELEDYEAPIEDFAQISAEPLENQAREKSLIELIQEFVWDARSADLQFYEASIGNTSSSFIRLISSPENQKTINADGQDCVSIKSFKNGSLITLTKQFFWKQACQLADSLAQQGVLAGDYLLVSTQSSLDQLSGFWASLIVGARYVPVLRSSGKSEEALEEKLGSVIELLGIKWLLTCDCSIEFPDVQTLSFPSVLPDLITPRQEVIGGIDDADIAIVALTSGSTGVPKAVPLTQSQIYHQLVGFNHLLETGAEDVFLNWMPLDHAASLIMLHLQAIYSGSAQVQLPTLDVLADPKLLLEIITDLQVTTTWSPNFAFNLLAQLNQIDSDIDLSSIKRWINGGEAISLSAMEQFVAVFKSYGLKESAITPAWGMSETCSGVVADSNFSFDAHRKLGAIHVGQPIPGFELRIVNGEGGVLKEGQVGRLQVRGLSVISGYLVSSQQVSPTADFDAGWFDVGDYASLNNRRVVIRGRNSDAIIVNGLNYYAGEIEAEITRSGLVQPGFVAALAIRFTGDNTDRLAIAYASLDQTVSLQEQEQIRSEIAEKVRSVFGVESEFIFALPMDEFPRTSLGKVQHKVIKQRIYAGELDDALKVSDHISSHPRSFSPGYYVPTDTKSESLHLPSNMDSAETWLVGLPEGFEKNFTRHYSSYYLKDSSLRFFRSIQEIPPALEDCEPGTLSLRIVFVADEVEGFKFDLAQHQQLLHLFLERGSSIDILGCSVESSGDYDVVRKNLFWQTAAIENPALRYGVLSLKGGDEASFTESIIPLLHSDISSLALSYRNHGWTQQKLEAISLPSSMDLKNALLSEQDKKGAVVLIGCGALALGMARVLVEELNKRVYLLGRRDPHEVNDGLFNSLLSRYPENVHYLRADASDFDSLDIALDTIHQQNAGDGIASLFQLAGMYGEQELSSLTQSQFEAASQLKLAIAQNVDRYFAKADVKENDLPRVIHFSSVNSQWPAAGVYGYALQNALLEQFCKNTFQRSEGLKHRALALPVWQDDSGHGVGAGKGLSANALELARSKGFMPLNTEFDFPRILQLAFMASDHPVVYAGLDADAPLIRSQLNNIPEPTLHCILTHDLHEEEKDRTSQLNRLQAQKSSLQDNGGKPVTLHWDGDGLLESFQAKKVRNIVEPSKPFEAELFSIWQTILPVTDFGVEDDFFALGGHSLSATRVIGRIREQLDIPLAVNELFQHSTIRQLAARLSKMQSGQGIEQIQPVPRLEKMPLSFAQQRLWFLYTLEGVSATYNIPAAVRMNGPLNVDALEKSFQTIIDRQEIMRCYFLPENEGGSIKVADNLQFRLQLETTQRTDLEKWVYEVYEHEAATGFDLTELPLFRVRLLKLAEQEHVLVITTHHIASDGWSVGVFIQELVAFYSGFVTNVSVPLPELPIQYLDFVQWQQSWFESREVNRQIEYWVEKLESAPPILDLPTDFPRPAIQRYVGAEQHFTIDGDQLAIFKRFCEQQGVTLYMFLLTCFNVLLYRHSQQEDIAVGTPVANRNRAELEPLLGLFVNTLVMRNSVTADLTFSQLLKAVKATALAAFDHQEAPFERVVEILQPDRSLSHSPLFQVMFILQNAPMEELQLLDLELSPIERESTVSKYDLTLQFVEYAGELKGALEFNCDLFSRDTVERMIRQLREILQFVVSHPESAVSDIPLLDRTSEIEMLRSWNETTRPLKNDAPFYQQILTQCRCNPDTVAVRVEETDYSYGELEQEIERIASALITRGVVAGDLVAVTLERGFSLVASLIAVLKTGAAYIPIDPEYPEERVRYMLDHAQPKVVLASESVAQRLGFSAQEVLLLESLTHSDCSSTSIDYVGENDNGNCLAYVIYTSGSTGKPKGVKIHHNAILNLLEYFGRLLDVQQGERWLAVTSLSFDIATIEIFLPLMKGATINLATSEQSMRGDWLLDQVSGAGIDYLQATPATWQLLLESGWSNFDTTQLTALCGGEALKKSLAGKILPQVQQLFNVYGPTETTVWSLVQEVEELNSNIVEIGKPLDNTYLVVVDQYNNPVPVGVAGELLIGGLGVGQGYLHREDLTAERFIANPIKDQFLQEHAPILYRTGDLVRYRADGTLVYLDRIDHQVKIRGFRIELGEVEAALASHSSVSSAVAVARPQDDGSGSMLVAYVVMQPDEKFSANTLKEWVSHQLPHYMVPSIVAAIDAFPLTPNGKIDRKALPDIKSLPSYEDRIYVGPRDHIELKLIHLWEEVLNTGPISVTDNFFDLGGHSLLAMRLISRVQEIFNQPLPMSLLFQSTNVENMANYLRQSNDENRLAQKTALVCIEAGDPKLPPLFLVHPAGGSVFCYRELANSLETNQPVYGLQLPLDARGKPVESEIEAMATLYIDTIEEAFGDEQIILGGWSMGGVTAFEMARQLEERGRSPKLLMLIDSSAPDSYEYIEVLDELNLLVMMAMELGLQIHQLALPRVVGVTDEEGLQYLLELCKDHGLLPQNFDIGNIRDRLTLLRSNQDAQMSYKVGDYGGSITVIHAEQQVSIRTDQEFLGWKVHAGEIITDETPGDHFSLIRKPHVHVLAEILAKHMQPLLLPPATDHVVTEEEA